MGKGISNLLTEDKFWRVIERSDQGQRMEECLTSLSDDELIGFKYWWDDYSNRLYRQDLWGVAYIVLGGCSDDGFEYFRNWILTQGRKVVNDALKNADSLCDIFENFDGEDLMDYIENEEVNYDIIEAIENRASHNEDFQKKLLEFSFTTQPQEMEFEWDEDNPESLRAICPRTFDRFM